MRRIMAAVLYLSVILLPCSAASWQVGLDARCLDSVFYPSARVDAEVSYMMGQIRITVPLRYSHSLDHALGFAETGILVSVYPFENHGFFGGVSLIRAGFFHGLEAPAEPLMLFSEVVVGWTFGFPWFFFEPRIAFTDIFSAEEGRMGQLRDAIPQYSPVRVSLIIGTQF